MLGRTLVVRKVKKLVSMAARLDKGQTRGKEFNVYRDAAAAQRVFAHWPRPLVVSPFELGRQVLGRAYTRSPRLVATEPPATRHHSKNAEQASFF